MPQAQEQDVLRVRSVTWAVQQDDAPSSMPAVSVSLAVFQFRFRETVAAFTSMEGLGASCCCVVVPPPDTHRGSCRVLQVPAHATPSATTAPSSTELPSPRDAIHEGRQEGNVGDKQEGSRDEPHHRRVS